MDCNCKCKINNNCGNLIETLQKAQETHGWLSPETLEKIAEETGISLAKIIGVVTFYAQFRTKPTGKNLILLCQGTACHVNGSAEIERAIIDELSVTEGETTQDGLFTYNNVACLGCCSLSPVMTIKSSASGENSASRENSANGVEKVYGKLTKESTVEILRGLK